MLQTFTPSLATIFGTENFPNAFHEGLDANTSDGTDTSINIIVWTVSDSAELAASTGKTTTRAIRRATVPCQGA
ncbi:MAG: hypothetical protein AB7K64_12925 [Variibacter sp.]